MTGSLLGGLGALAMRHSRMRSEELARNLRYERDRAQSYLDVAGVILVAIGTDGKTLLINRRGCEILGYPEEDIIGRDWFDNFLPERNRERVRRMFVRLAEGVADPAEDAEGPILTAEGTERSIAWHNTVIRDTGGRVYATLSSGQDVTERKQAEAALLESQRDLERAQAVAETGSWRLDVRRDELVWSDETHRIFGIPKGTPMTYETFLRAVHPEDREYVDRKWNAALHGEPYDVEHRIVVDGAVRWVRERAEPELDDSGNLLGGFGTAQDITERKRAEQALLEAEEHKLEFYRRTVLAATDGKLQITDHDTISAMAGEPLAVWMVERPMDTREARHGAGELAQSLGMSEARRQRLITCVGEAATNALKHAGGGRASLHRLTEALMFVMSDAGPGIEAMSLPDLALTRGYSTAGTLGMGYKVMTSFGDKVYLATDDSGTTVAVEMSLTEAEMESCADGAPDYAVSI